MIVKFSADDYPSERQLAGMQRALRLGQLLQGDFVVPHLCLEVHGQQMALVTEDYGAQSLDHRPKPLELASFLHISGQIALALAHLHSHEITHKDIKPANIVQNPQSGLVKLIDLEIASQLSQETATTTDVPLIEGTLIYIAPEQTGRMNRSVDHRSDLYAMGATLYELLTGRTPFPETNPRALLHAHLARDPAPIRQIVPQVPQVVADIVHRLLRKEPAQRYQTALGVADDLERCLVDLQVDQLKPFPLATRDIPTQFRLPDTLFGRSQDKQILLDAYQRVKVGNTESLWISGAPGIGKSALIQEVHRPISKDKGWLCEGKFDQFRRDLPYHAWIGVLNAIVQQQLTEPDAVLDPLRRSLANALARNAALLTEVVPELIFLLGEQEPPPPVSPSEAKHRFNQSFRTFLRVIATPEHPLVLTLDDLQWADLASLQLLESLLIDRELAHILFIGAFRDAEVGPDHALRALRSRLKDRALAGTTIVLDRLSEGHTAELIAATVHQEAEAVGLLATTVHKRTDGNPFFVRQFLETLHRKSLLYFDIQRRSWTWEISDIQQEQITDNVATLMSKRVQDLVPNTRDILELASCMGAQFDLGGLAAIRRTSWAQSALELRPALDDGLVVPLDQHYKFILDDDSRETNVSRVNPRYRFLHDRVQQAAHEGLSNERRAQLHHQIGQRLWGQRGEDAIIDIADHLAHGLGLIDPAQSVAAAQLFLDATQRAKRSMATAPGRKYASAGLQLLGEQPWTEHRELALALHTAAADLAYIEGDFAAVKPHNKAVLDHAIDRFAKVPIHNIRIGMGVASEAYVEATQLAVEVLARDFDVDLPRNPLPLHVLAGVVRIRWTLYGQADVDLLNRPEMTDRGALASMNLLMKTSTNAYWGMPNLVPLIAFEMLHSSAKHGNTDLTAYGYALYGMILAAALGDVDGGYRYGGLAMRLLEQRKAVHLRGKTGLLWHGFIRHAKDPLHECATATLAHYHPALDAGDVENAVYCGTVAYSTDLMAGHSLDWVENRYKDYLPALLESGQDQTVYALKVWLQAIENLRNPGDVRSQLSGEILNFPELLPQLEAESKLMAIASGVCAAGWLAFLLEDEETAVTMWGRLYELEDKAPGQAHLKPCLALYAALLSRKRALGTLGVRERIRLGVLQIRTGVWSRQNAHDYLPYKHFLDAECALAAGRNGQAQAAFHNAISTARAAGNGFLEASACTRAAGIHGDLGHLEFARHLTVRSQRLWHRYGASARFVSQSGPSASNANGISSVTYGSSISTQQIDLEPILEIVRSVAQEIKIDMLATKVAELALLHAGARVGVLLVREGRNFVPQARVAINQAGEVTATHTADASIPTSVVDYVSRTQQPLIVDDASSHALFAKDAHVRSENSLSILVTPLMHHGEIVGQVVLENNKGRGVFTSVHAQILETIAGQAVVSLINARQYEAQRLQAEAFSRFVPRQFLEHLGVEKIEEARLGHGIERSVSILFSDLRGFTELSESMSPEDNFAFINGYLARMTSAIQVNGGFVDAYIGDAIMALFVDNPDGAVRAGIAMQKALEAYNIDRVKAGRASLNMGIGVHTGDVLLGIIGSPDRIQANVTGDAVNAASRLEGLTKPYQTPFLISERTRSGLADPTTFRMRSIGKVKVEGRKSIIEVHEILDARNDADRDALQTTAVAFGEALEAFMNREFKRAKKGFEQCAKVAQADHLATIYAERATRNAADGVPEDWEGVDVRTGK
ncbi:MAG: AAA family ATPase [Rhodobacterales bacterium]|nr:AAA family ATPase [Rhodobacterales bacterium]